MAKRAAKKKSVINKSVVRRRKPAVKAAVSVETGEIKPVAAVTAGEEYDITRVLKNTWGYYTGNFWTGILVTLLACAVSVPFIISVFSSFAVEFVPDIFDTDWAYLWMALFYVVCGYAAVFMFTMFDKRGTSGRQEKPWLMDAIISSAGGLFRVFLLCLIIFGLILLFLVPLGVLGMLFADKSPAVTVLLIVVLYAGLITASIYFGLTYGQAFVIAAIEPKVIAALKESAAISIGKRLKIFLTWLVAYVIMMVVEVVLMICAFAAGFAMSAGGKPETIMVAGLIIFIAAAMVLFMPLCYAFYFAIYKEAKSYPK